MEQGVSQLADTIGRTYLNISEIIWISDMKLPKKWWQRKQH